MRRWCGWRGRWSRAVWAVAEALGVGLVGAGKIGREHARNLARRLDGARLVAVADTVPAVAEEVAGQLGVRAVYHTPGELLADDAVDAVVIATPATTHAELISAAAAARRQVFCEKPIALDLAAADAALAAVTRAGVTLQVGFQRRFDRSFRRARELVAEGRIGRPRLVRIISRDPRPGPIEYLRDSGGLFMDMTIHDFDLARFLIADEVEEVTAVGAVLVDAAIGIEANDLDTAIVTLRYAGGALGVIDNCRQASYGYDQRAEVFGSEGAIMVGNELLDATTLVTADGARGANPKPWFRDRYADAYAAEMQAFVDAVRSGRPAEVGGDDGRAPIAIALAAQRSVREGRAVPVSSVEPARPAVDQALR
jgi:myo-inositol 2-dehydrogenase / D-chiro-inositol 1-dehydrogenase